MDQKAKTIFSEVFDFLIVGTGMGGGPIGLRLAQAGFSVLFIEKGRAQNLDTSLKGKYAELFFQKDSSSNEKIEILKNAGRFFGDILDQTRSIKGNSIFPFMGSGVGGSSALFGMVLERFKSIDFEGWPISLSELVPYYEQAEALFQVKKMIQFRHPGHQVLSGHLSNIGLHPYTLPLANKDVENCNQCQSYLCQKNCKNDSYQVCIRPAVTQWNAKIVTNCKVEKIIYSKEKATGVIATYHGELIEVKGKNIIISAGALESPRILQNSISSEFPRGIGNNFDLVGRYLMRHFVDLFSLKIDSDSQNPYVKELGVNDFYFYQNMKLGVVQSFERLPPNQVILEKMKFPCKSLFLPLIRFVLDLLRTQRLVLCSLIEDKPQFENRVWCKDNKICISYKISKEDAIKIKWFRKKLLKTFQPFRPILLKSAEKNEMLAHACGTCRMGTDPTKSIVNRDNQVHGIENLYVVDSSFFPTSGGTNPALTIASNSLRVADRIITFMKKDVKNV